jgi:hypothetical protein
VDGGKDPSPIEERGQQIGFANMLGRRGRVGGLRPGKMGKGYRRRER